MILPIVLYLYVAGKCPSFILLWAKLIGLTITLFSINADLFFSESEKKFFKGDRLTLRCPKVRVVGS